jgi:hypothetical protein
VAGQTVEVALSNPGPSATFPIPATIVPFVDSVFAEIDNGAGADATPTLEIRGPNGDTVAAVPQDDVVPGGDTGRATWALRLPGKGRGRGRASPLASCTCLLDVSPGSFAAGNVSFPITQLATDSPATFSTVGGGSAQVTVLKDGFYLAAGHIGFAVVTTIDFFLDLSVIGRNAAGWSADLDTVPGDVVYTPKVSYVGGLTFQSFFAGDTIELNLQNDGPIANLSQAGLAIQRLSATQLF